MRKSMGGFTTIVELLIVIAIVGILVIIGAIGFNRYQADGRDFIRSSKITILSAALEKYYDNNGEYPSCGAMTGTVETVTTNVLPGVQPDTLVAPLSAPGVTTSISCIDITGSAGEPDVFAYVGDDSTACTTNQYCLSYRLKYKEEWSGQIKVIASRR